MRSRCLVWCHWLTRHLQLRRNQQCQYLSSPFPWSGSHRAAGVVFIPCRAKTGLCKDLCDSSEHTTTADHTARLLHFYSCFFFSLALPLMPACLAPASSSASPTRLLLPQGLQSTHFTLYVYQWTYCVLITYLAAIALLHLVIKPLIYFITLAKPWTTFPNFIRPLPSSPIKHTWLCVRRGYLGKAKRRGQKSFPESKTPANSTEDVTAVCEMP